MIKNSELLRPGDIFVTRNEDETQNQSPGYWNHIAIYTNNGIVEAQSPPWNSIICTPIDEFVKRYYKFQVYRWNEEIGVQTANGALLLIGESYGKLNSLWYNIFKGLFSKKRNCVSAVRSLYHKVLGYDPGWIIPDDVTKDKRLTLIFTKDEGK